MSAELYRCQLRARPQEIVIAKMRAAINELADLADSFGLSSVAYLHGQRRIDELRQVGELKPRDVMASDTELLDDHRGSDDDE